MCCQIYFIDIYYLRNETVSARKAGNEKSKTKGERSYEEKTGKEILDAQVGYFLKTRNNMKVFKNEISKTYADKTIKRGYEI